MILVSAILMILITPGLALSSDEVVTTRVPEGVIDQVGTSASDVMDWLLINTEALVAGAVIILTGLAGLAALTPTPTDDKWVAKLLAFFKLWPKKKE